MARPAFPLYGAPRLLRRGSTRNGRAVVAILCCFCSAAALVAQPTTRVAANIPALAAFPTFYHLRSIIIRGELVTRDDRRELLAPDGDRGVDVVFRGSHAPDGLVELRGVCWDIGRMTPDDPNFAGFDIQAFLDTRRGGSWPKPGELIVISASDATPATPPPAPSIRALVLDPSRYVAQKITVTGEFRGSNLYADLPKAPVGGKWDFVLRSANAAVWVTGLRPRGRGFDLDPRARVDTGRVLEVTGVARTKEGLVWLEATAIAAPAITAVQPGDEPAEADPTPPPPPMPPPSVIFSLPIEGETDVSPAAPVRIQLSRNLDRETLKDRIRLSYATAAPAGMPQAPSIAFTIAYNAADRIIEVRFTKPLDSYRTVKVELLEGIVGADGQPLKPWTLTFTTGSKGDLASVNVATPEVGVRRKA